MIDNVGCEPEARGGGPRRRRSHEDSRKRADEAGVSDINSSAPFPTAFTCLVRRRGFSYRQLAYKTRLSSAYLNHISNGSRSVPGDIRIRQIARALGVPPDFFVEYRRRRLAQLLAGSVPLLDELYVVLCEKATVTDELPRLLTDAAKHARRRPKG